jgi:SPP1 gp7 family putative phage head morphogenesis protein
MAEQLPISFEGQKTENNQPIIYYNLTNMNPHRASDIIQNDIGLYRVKQDILRWRNAIIYAENKKYPNRTEYYRLCKDVVLDPHLTSVINQRKKAVLARELVLVDANGEINEEKTKLFKKKWFRKLLDYCLDAKYYGFSLIDLGPLVDDAFPDIRLVPRQYVRPELNIVVNALGGMTGVSLDDPKYSKWNIFIGEREDLGLLAKAAPYTIWKKNAFGYWSEYCEKFGMPLRVGKTNVKDDELKLNMETALRTMGSAFWSMINSDDDIELISSAIHGAWENFDKMGDRVNNELSKLILCQTGTTDEKSFAGSSAVHQDVMGDVTEADIADLEGDLNEIIAPIFNFHGLGLEGLTFEFRYKESISLVEKAKIAASFMPYVKFNKEDLEKTYGIKLDDQDDKPDGEPDGKKSSTNYASITNEYNCGCGICGGWENKDKDFVGDPFSEEDRDKLLKAVQEGIVNVYNLPLWVYEKTTKILEQQVLRGFEASTFGTGDSLLNELRHNIYVFSAAKTYQQVRDIQTLLVRYPKRKDLFIKKASEAFDDYNKNWLSVEVDTAYNSALQGREWKKIESMKGVLPFLEYQTAGDDRVRPTHAALDGIIRKVDDGFWDTYYPPNGWRCRCTTIQHEDVVQVTSLKDFKAPDDVPDVFKMNVGKDGMIFSEKHPYFQVAKGDKEWAKQNFGLPLP